MTSRAGYVPLLFIVTGSQGAGKTTFCGRLVESAREAGWRVSGVLSLPIFDGEQRVAIHVQDLTSGETRPLAERSDRPSPGSKHWRFDSAALEWGSAVLERSTPADLLVIDELGPLEFEREAGWQSGIAAVESRAYAIALVVIRAEMLGEALVRWSDANLIEIDTPEDSARKAQILADQLF